MVTPESNAQKLGDPILSYMTASIEIVYRIWHCVLRRYCVEPYFLGPKCNPESSAQVRRRIWVRVTPKNCLNIRMQRARNYKFCTLVYFETFWSVFIEAVNPLS